MKIRKSKVVRETLQNLGLSGVGNFADLETPEFLLLKDEIVAKGQERRDELDLMIKNGWGETRQSRLPEDWRTRRKGE